MPPKATKKATKKDEIKAAIKRCDELFEHVLRLVYCFDAELYTHGHSPSVDVAATNVLASLENYNAVKEPLPKTEYARKFPSSVRRSLEVCEAITGISSFQLKAEEVKKAVNGLSKSAPFEESGVTVTVQNAKEVVTDYIKKLLDLQSAVEWVVEKEVAEVHDPEAAEAEKEIAWAGYGGTQEYADERYKEVDEKTKCAQWLADDHFDRLIKYIKDSIDDWTNEMYILGAKWEDLPWVK